MAIGTQKKAFVKFRFRFFEPPVPYAFEARVLVRGLYVVEFESILALVVSAVLAFPTFVVQVPVLIASSSLYRSLVMTRFAKGF
jgi:hypothetical protein